MKTAPARSSLADAERKLRSRIARWSTAAGCCMAPWRRARVCGKPNCRCAQGHASLYLVRSRRGKVQQLFCRAAGSNACDRTINSSSGCSKRSPSRSGSKTAGRSDVLRRLIQYAEKGYGLRSRLLAGVSDSRPKAHPHPRCRRVDAGAVLGPAGSLNALETLEGAPFWKKWLGRNSADTISRSTRPCFLSSDNARHRD